MSDMPNNSTSEAQLVSGLYDILAGYEADVGLLALSVWEYVITFDQEVSTVWQATRFSGSSLLLLVTRYGMLIEVLVQLLRGVLGISSCKVSVIILEGLALLSYIVIALFSALRVSAMWDRNYYMFTILLVLGLAPVATDIFYISHYQYSHIGKPLPISCSASPNISAELYYTLTLVTRIPLIVADFGVLALTWMKTYTQIQSARRLQTPAPMVACLARDGTIYFIALLIMNIVQMLLGTSLVKGHSIGSFIAALPPILINRFILNLRQAIDSPTTMSAVPSHVTDVAFLKNETVFANLGEPLEYGGSRDVEFEDGMVPAGVAEHDSEFEDLVTDHMQFASRPPSADIPSSKSTVDNFDSASGFTLDDIEAALSRIEDHDSSP